MAFIDEQQGVFRQIFKQGGRWFAGQAAGEEAAVILDARARPGGGDHFQIKIGALLQPLRFQQLAFGVQLLQPLGQFVANGVGGLLHGRAGRHIVAVGVDLDLIELGHRLAGERIKFGNLLDLVAEEADAPGAVFIVGGVDFQGVAAHPEIAARETEIAALVLHGDELPHHLLQIGRAALLQGEGHRRIGLDRADAINAGNRRDDDHVIALQQGTGGGMAHPVDGLVHARFLFDIGIGARHIGFGLVIIVIGNEIFHRIIGEEALEFAV